MRSFQISDSLLLISTVSSNCHPNPCLHGGTCLEKDGGFSCKCIGAYRGQTCDGKLHWISRPQLLLLLFFFLISRILGPVTQNLISVYRGLIRWAFFKSVQD